MLLYKGAGPGTHWWNTDPRTMGGFPAAPGIRNVDAAVRHITAFSHPSPYMSFTASYAIACAYAALGTDGPAEVGRPGYVFEIDTAAVPDAGLILVDPARDILVANPAVGDGPHLLTHHDGDQQLILGIASRAHKHILTQPPRRPGGNAGPAAAAPPTADMRLHALIFALRDAEVLIGGAIPAACISHRYEIV